MPTFTALARVRSGHGDDVGPNHHAAMSDHTEVGHSDDQQAERPPDGLEVRLIVGGLVASTARCCVVAPGKHAGLFDKLTAASALEGREQRGSSGRRVDRGERACSSTFACVGLDAVDAVGTGYTCTMSLAMNTYAGLPQHQATSLQLARRASVDLAVRPISDQGLDRLLADLLRK